MPILGVIASGISGHLTPPWPDNSYYQIATTTVGAGGSATVTFSSIPATYTHLQLRILSKTTDTAFVEDNTNLYFNSDTTYTNYRGHWLRGDGTTVTASSIQASGYQVYYGVMPASNASQTSMFAATIIDILDYANTNKYKTVRIINGNDNNNTSLGFIGLYSNVWMSSSAITSITFTVPGGTNYAQNSRFALYGIKVS
jgi:hypothetical protein